MEQEKVGKFIAEKRKELQMTQKELAESIGVTDKTVSKWETGMRLPDASILLDVCEVLQVDVNELLAGKAISGKDYADKAASNFVDLVEEINTSRKRESHNYVGVLIGTICVLAAMALLIIRSIGFFHILVFLDVPTALFLFGITLLVLRLADELDAYMEAYSCCVRNVSLSLSEMNEVIYAVKFASLLMLIVSVIISLFGVIGVIGRLGQIETLGPMLAQVILSALYTAIMEFIHILLLNKLYKKRREHTG